MNFEDYINKAKEFDLRHNLEFYHAGLTEEVGELSKGRKKLIRGDYSEPYHSFKFDNYMMQELGDILWFWVLLCYKYSYDPSKIMDINIKKLEERKSSGTIKR